MSQEELLVDTFVTLADTLVDDYDLIDFMQTLSERCVALLEVSAAGIMLADPDGNLRHIACSSEQMRLVEVFEVQLQEGPCFDAYRDERAVTCHSLEAATDRWPSFAGYALDHGFQAASAVPMRLRTAVLGALNLFSDHERALDDAEIAVAQALADVATIGILQHRAIHDTRALATQLEGALQSRVVIEQAKGILAERTQISVDEAFDRFRRYARARNLRLSDVARDIVDGALPAASFTEPSRPISSGG